MRLWRAFRRVFRAPGLLLFVLLMQLGLAWFIGSTVSAAASSALRDQAIGPGTSRLYGMLELFTGNPAVVTTWQRLLPVSALLNVFCWTFLAAGIIERLRRPLSAAGVVAVAFRWWPAMVVTTLWNWVPRLIVLALGGFLSRILMDHEPWGWWAAGLTMIGTFFCTCALDLARVQVVLGRAQPFSLRTAAAGFRRAWRQPSVLLTSLLLSLGQWLMVVAIAWLAFTGFRDGDGLGLPRLLSALGALFGLVRIAVAVDALTESGRPQ